MDPLAEMFRHHAWATETLIDFCAGLPVERLEAAAPGTYGTIIETLTHLVAADQRYLRHMTGEEADPRVRDGMLLSLDELKAAFAAGSRRWLALLPRVAELDVLVPGDDESGPIPHATELVIVQAIHHGNDHRTQVCTILGAAGEQPPEIDVWTYWLAVHP